VNTPATVADRDALLARLLSELADAGRRGAQPDVEGLAARHPDVAAELRELWAAAQVADVLTWPHVPQAAQPAATPNVPRSFGEYDLLEEIGRGGMGVVYRAWHRRLQRLAAVKMVLHGNLAADEDRRRFEAEARAVAHLDHPNIVSLYEAGEIDGQAYFSMRFVEGQTLAAVLARGPMKPREAAGLLEAVCRAVQYAHDRGIVHRDLKPSNILIDDHGQPHVTDFGLAKRLAAPLPATPGSKSAERLTISGAVLGTPAYMAPEQVSGRRGTLSPSSDVYSLGVILYEMLTGRPPFQAASPVDTLLLVLDQDPVRPRLLNPNVDPDLELICLKCLQKAPDLRYRSAAALAEDLAAFLDGGSLSVRTSGIQQVGAVFSRVFRETPHAVVLENWGLLWMWHSVKVFLLCVLTTALWWGDVTRPLWYLLLWGGGLVIWGGVFWWLRKRGGPVLSIERQMAHLWGSAILGTIGVFIIEMLLGLPVLTLSPLLAVIAGMMFTAKGGMLSGSFYVLAAIEYLTAVPMAIWPQYGPLMFGAVTAICFFLPGWKYHRQRLRSRDGAAAEPK
jgi:serine/threonine-protein kinase